MAEMIPTMKQQHGGLAVWFTGLSGAGKTTLCRAVGSHLRDLGCQVRALDSEDLRHSMSRDLGFSKADRDENVFRLGNLAHSLVQQDVIVLVAAISPYREARSQARERIGSFLEVFVDAPLEICIRRDPKRLYARALHGQIPHFTGIDDPYEPPLEPNVHCETSREAPEESAAKVFVAIRDALQLQPSMLRET